MRYGGQIETEDMWLKLDMFPFQIHIPSEKVKNLFPQGHLNL